MPNNSSSHFQELRAPRHTIDGRDLVPSEAENPPFNYDILASLSYGYRDISDNLPVSPDIILRWFSDRFNKCRNQYDGQSYRIHDVLQSARIAEDHFNKLAEFGVNIPDYKHLAIGKDARHDDAVALYTTVEKLPLEPWENVSESFVDKYVFDPIRSYGEWLKTTKQPYMLLDIGWQMQYGIVADQEAAEGHKVYLIDVEPVVGHVNPYGLFLLMYESKTKLS